MPNKTTFSPRQETASNWAVIGALVFIVPAFLLALWSLLVLLGTPHFSSSSFYGPGLFVAISVAGLVSILIGIAIIVVVNTPKHPKIAAWVEIVIALPLTILFLVFIPNSNGLSILYLAWPITFWRAAYLTLTDEKLE